MSLGERTEQAEHVGEQSLLDGACAMGKSWAWDSASLEEMELMGVQPRRVQQQGLGYLISESRMKPVLPDKCSSSILSSADSTHKDNS